MMESIRADYEPVKAVLLSLYRDIQTHNSQYITSLDASRDMSYLASRFDKEGLSFITKALPVLDDALLQGLETGCYRTPVHFRSRGALPLLLRGLHKLIFCEDGMLLPTPDVVAIRDLRQFFAFFKKAEVAFTGKVIGAVLDGFVDVDSSLPASKADLPEFLSDVFEECRKFLGNLFDGFDPYDITPKHGPGATAGGQKPHEKRRPSANYRQLSDGGYPLYGYFFSGPSDLLRRVADFRNAEKLDFGRARVILVPKDSRGPRIISAEPLEYQYLQQGLRMKLQALLENHPSTRGRVNFTDQSINGEAALRASITGEWATVDLKEASDRVSVALVERIFPPHVLRALLALRTPETALPDGRIVSMRKYAPMGSALCFPVEALCFYTLARAMRRVMGGCLQGFTCLVYGDDIICDKRTLYYIQKFFPAVSLMLNDKKCFSKGKFRESCGVDAYDGVVVTPIRLRVIPRVEASRPADIVSLESTMNQLWSDGYYRTSEVLRSFLERKLRRRFIYKLTEAGYLGLTLPRNEIPTKGLRYDKRRCAFRAKAYVLRTKSYEKADSDGLTDDREYFRKLTQGWHPDYTAGLYSDRYAVSLTPRTVTVLS